MSVRLQFQGIRCFPTKQDAVIRPLTLLVGENSSGKSTFLALCRDASSIILGLTGVTSFNEPPFLLGAYDQIASNRNGHPAESFTITFVVDACGAIEARFVSRGGQPTLVLWTLETKEDVLVLKPEADGVTIVLKNRERQGVVLEGLSQAGWAWLWAGGDASIAETQKVFGADVSVEQLVTFRHSLNEIRASFGRAPYAFAPIRSNPIRTYDPVRISPNPEGSHVPMALAEMSAKSRKDLSKNLSKFGKKSGLFDEIDVVRKGKKESDPFQIGVKSGASSHNLVDVGYGVSQVLPILVDTLQRSGTNDVFLLQQPEVHLHPSAQAELGSYFAHQVKKNGRFVIETHSDYIVDRVRMEVRKKTLRPEDVSLLYFERGKKGAMIHHLELAKDGSITNPPKGYREFFLNESNRLLDL